MDRRAFIGNLAAGILGVPRAVFAQATHKVHRIGILGTYPPTTPEYAHLWAAFMQGLQKLGYIEGQNIAIERRFMEGKAERLPGSRSRRPCWRARTGSSNDRYVCALRGVELRAPADRGSRRSPCGR